MAQAKLNSQEETSSTLNDKEKETDEKEGRHSETIISLYLLYIIY